MEARKPNRPLAGPGDDVGAADLGRRVAENLRAAPQGARACRSTTWRARPGVSRAALSQIETCKSNPTVGVLWKIAVGLGVPFAELIGAPRSGAMVLRRATRRCCARQTASSRAGRSTPAGASPLVELYELRLSARSTHASEAARPGHPRAPRRAERAAQDARRRRGLRARRRRLGRVRRRPPACLREPRRVARRATTTSSFTSGSGPRPWFDAPVSFVITSRVFASAKAWLAAGARACHRRAPAA